MAGQFEAELVGEVDGITVEYFAISVERKLSHPARVAISEAAKADRGR